ncbi:hypothetical protein D3C71_1139170 [compost metagenome]
MLSCQFFFSDESNRSIIICKIVRHIHDFCTNAFLICPCLSHYKTLSKVFLASGKLWCFTSANGLNNLLYWNGILYTSFNSIYSADRIGVALANAFAPEGVFFTLWKNSFSEQTIH